MSDELLVEVRDHVAWLTVNRPAVRNALSAKLCRDLAGEIRRLGADKDVRVLVLRGSGDRVFVSGADVNEFRASLASAQSALDYDANAELLQSAIRGVGQPVIAMIQGYAVGSGCIVAVACDFRIAAKPAKFGIPVAKFGFIAPLPDVLRLVDLVGPAKAKWLLMSAKLIDADQALAWGLIDQVTEPEALLAETEAFAQTLAQNSPLSIKASKQMIEHWTGPTADVYRGAAWYAEVFKSRDFQEGLDAFFAKRKPVFRGD
jgi:enoyl-CoA hydratase/carnithine racemase